VSRQRGQGLVEFAIVLPVLLSVVFGVLEGTLLMFTVDSARFAVGEGARLEAESGTAANADTASVQLIRTGPFGQTALATVTSIDVDRLTVAANGVPSKDATKHNSYRLDGTTLVVGTWPPSARNVRSGSSDFLRLTINFQYSWLSGKLLATGPLVLSQSFDVQLEPQSY
jgi:Flp pilus assembly protein TadG